MPVFADKSRSTVPENGFFFLASHGKTGDTYTVKYSLLFYQHFATGHAIIHGNRVNSPSRVVLWYQSTFTSVKQHNLCSSCIHSQWVRPIKAIQSPATLLATQLYSVTKYQRETVRWQHLIVDGWIYFQNGCYTISYSKRCWKKRNSIITSNRRPSICFVPCYPFYNYIFEEITITVTTTDRKWHTKQCVAVFQDHVPLRTTAFPFLRDWLKLVTY